MIRRVVPLALTVLVSCTLLSQPASASPISLASAIAGTAAGGDLFDLTVSYDSNGSAATNLVGMELYVGFTGLAPVTGSYLLGSVFAGVPSSDLLAIDGLCSNLGSCSYPATDPASPQHYLSLASVFAPSVAAGQGTLFTLQFIAPGAGQWTLNLFGDDQGALLWDPPPTCDPNDPNCADIPEPVPFEIVVPGTQVASGTARVDVGLDMLPASPAVVPEPTSLLLLGSGLVGAVLRRRALRRKQS